MIRLPVGFSVYATLFAMAALISCIAGKEKREAPKSPRELGQSVLDALKEQDVDAFRSLIITGEDVEAILAGTALPEFKKEAARSCFLDKIAHWKELDTDKDPFIHGLGRWDLIDWRTIQTDSIVSEEVTMNLDDVARSTKQICLEEVPKTNIRIYLTYGDQHFALLLNGCMKAGDRWVILEEVVLNNLQSPVIRH